MDASVCFTIESSDGEVAGGLFFLFKEVYATLTSSAAAAPILVVNFVDYFQRPIDRIVMSSAHASAYSMRHKDHHISEPCRVVSIDLTCLVSDGVQEMYDKVREKLL